MGEENKVEQFCLFERDPKLWEKEWKGMTEFSQGNIEPFRTIRVHFQKKEDVELFSALIEQRISEKTKYVWFPKIELIIVADKRWISRLKGEGETNCDIEEDDDIEEEGQEE